MKKASITAILMFAAAFALYFSFQKEKKEFKSSIKKMTVSKTEKSAALSPEKVITNNQNSNQQTSPKDPTYSASQELASPQETLASLFKKMPRTGELNTVASVDLHNTPEVILDAGEVLADVHEYFVNNPQPRDVEMSFYLKCSQQKDFFDSIRAICAARLSQQYFEATGHQISADLFDSNIDILRREINL